jgi:hypothetical protein
MCVTWTPDSKGFYFTAGKDYKKLLYFRWPSVVVLLLFSPFLALAFGMITSSWWLWRGNSAKWKHALVLQGISAMAFLDTAIFSGVFSLQNFIRGYQSQIYQQQSNQALVVLWLIVLPSVVCLIISSVTCFYLTRALKDRAVLADINAFKE